jgi:hypothetical protein
MTPHRFHGRGTLVLDRVFDSIGRIQRASGTNDLAVFKECDAMLTAFWSMGRPDLLEEIRDGRVKAVVALGWFRLGRLDRIPTGESLRTVKGAWEAWVQGQDIPARSKQDLGYTLAALLGRGTEERTDLRIVDVPARFAEVCREKAGKARAIQKMKAHVQAFLRDLVGDDHAVYVAIRRVKIGKVRTLREGRPRLPEEILELTQRMKHGAADVWSLCATGMLPKEYAGVWRLGKGRVEIDGTKTSSRKRFVPLFLPVTRPSLHARTLSNLVRELSDGEIQVKDFRDTFARWCREAGVSSLNRKLYMGHGPTTMTEHYEWGEIPGQLAADEQLLRAYVHQRLEAVGGRAMLRLHQGGGA